MTADDTFLDGVLLDGRAGQRQDEEDRLQAGNRLAAALVRRHAMRHDPACRRRWCRHRNHRRDRRHMLMLLDMLGLEDVRPLRQDYESKLAWATMTADEAALMKGGSTF